MISVNRIITLDSARTIGNIYAQDTTHSYTISGTNTLTLDVSSGQSILNVVTSGRTLTIGTPVTVNDGIEKTGAGGVSINNAVTLGAAQTWLNNSSGALAKTHTGLLDIMGYQLTFDGTGTISIGTISNNTSAVLTGSGNLVKNGTGRVSIGGLNTGFTGTVTINGGVLQMTNHVNGLGAGNVTLNGGVLSIYRSVTYTRSLGTGDNEVQILGGNSGFAGAGTSGPTINLGTSVQWGSAYFNPAKFVLGDEGTHNAGVTTFSSAIDLNGAERTILVPAGLSANRNRSTISGRIYNSTGMGNLVKEGVGILTLTYNYSAANPGWNGSTTVNEGVLNFAAVNMDYIGGGVGRNITVASGAGVRFNGLSKAILNRIVETNDTIHILTGPTGTGSTSTNALDFSSSTGANLPNGFLGSWSNNNSPTRYYGTITPASDNYRLGTPHNPTAQAFQIGGVLSGDQGLLIGGGTVLLSNSGNTFNGDTVVQAGRLALGKLTALQNSALNTDSGSLCFTDSGSALPDTEKVDKPVLGGLIGSRDLLTMYNAGTLNNVNRLAVGNVLGITLNPGTGKTHTYSGNVALNTTMYLAKTGDGTQILSGANTYGGGTTISAGTLLINNTTGSGTGTGAVTVSGGTLGGTGIISGAVTVESGGAIAPGASIGTLTVQNDVTWDAGTAWKFELGAAGVSKASPGTSDLLDITGSSSDFIKGSGSGWTFDFAGTGAEGWYRLVAWEGTTDFAATDFTATNLTSGLAGSFDIDGNALYLQVNPEPGTMGVVAFFGVVLLARRRFQRN